ncbi:MAG: EAL domain-containing protein [Clostridia bacterium]|nr:EAL domain-containing protein [Clostridia bacterium]
MKNKLSPIFITSLTLYICFNIIVLALFHFLWLNPINNIFQTQYNIIIHNTLSNEKLNFQNQINDIEKQSNAFRENLEHLNVYEKTSDYVINGLLLQQIKSNSTINDIALIITNENINSTIAIDNIDYKVSNTSYGDRLPYLQDNNQWINGWTSYYEIQEKLVISYILNVELFGTKGVLITTIDLDVFQNIENADHFDGIFWLIDEENHTIFSPALSLENTFTTNVQIKPSQGKTYTNTRIDNDLYRNYTQTLPFEWQLIYTIKEKTLLNDIENFHRLGTISIISISTLIVIIFQYFYMKHEKKLNLIHKNITYLQQSFEIEPLAFTGSGPVVKLSNAIDRLQHSLNNKIHHLETLAYLDQETKLENWEYLKNEFDYLVSNQNGILYLIDIDEYSHITRLIGKNNTSNYLKFFSRHLAQLETENLKLYHLEHDVFAFLQLAEHFENVTEFAKSLQEHIQLFVYSNDSRFSATCSIGIAKYPEDANNITALKACAEAALFDAKEDGFGLIKIYSRFLMNKTDQIELLKKEIQEGILNQEFTVYYQPIINGENKHIAFEALLRWNHPLKGPLLPNSFLNCAIKWGYINEIGEQIFEKIARDVLKFIKHGYTPDFISLNLSTREILSPLLISRMLSIIREHNLPKRSIAIEIKESSLKYDREKSLKKLHALHVAGIQIILDDFASEEGQFKNIHDLPIDYIKINAMTLTQSNQSKRITHAMITMLHELNIKIIGKSVSNVEQLDKFKLVGVDGFQGNGIHSAQPIEVLIETLVP